MQTFICIILKITLVNLFVLIKSGCLVLSQTGSDANLDSVIELVFKIKIKLR